MAIKSFKEKISNIAGGEILGETDFTEEEKLAMKKKGEKKENKKSQAKVRIRKPEDEEESNNKVNIEKPKKTQQKSQKEPKQKKKREKTFSFLKPKQEEEIEENTTQKTSDVKEKDEEEKTIVKDSIPGYEDVLSILGIKENLSLDVDFTSDQLDYVEFTQTQPLGFDFDEVTDFISRTKYTMYKLESALKQREKDLIRVASEAKKVEQRMIEKNQEKELEKMLGGMTEEERLIEENMDLKVQINELSRKAKDGSNKQEIEKLKREIETLKAENELLIQNKENLNKPKEKTANKLPSFEDEEKEIDMINNMLQDIGGVYDDE